MEQINPIRLYKVREVSRLLSLSESAVRRLVEDERLSVRRIHRNSHPRIVGQSIIDYLEAATTAGAVANA